MAVFTVIVFCEMCRLEFIGEKQTTPFNGPYVTRSAHFIVTNILPPIFFFTFSIVILLTLNARQIIVESMR